MKTVNTILGEVVINDTSIVRSSGYGQYTIVVDITFEGQQKTLKLHSTDSQLFDAANGEDNHSEIVLEAAKYTIERGVEDYINSL